MRTPENVPAAPGTATSADPKSFKTFQEFYPYYLAEHSNVNCRRLHFIGSTLALACLGLLFWTGSPYWLLAGLLFGYGCAWIGHLVFEKNRPATFRRPLYSFLGDWAMYRDILAGRLNM